jgi:predicted DsbA family dithiol-disulfide isomerase
MRIDIWTDIVCPWCYIGKRRFERALETFPHRSEIQVVHRSFQLNPEAPKGATSDRRAHLMAKYAWSDAQAQAMDANMERIAAAEGLVYHLAGGVTGNTFDAHRVMHLGRDRGVQDAVVERLYRAYFTEQRSIFDHDSLAALAVAAGLDAGEARRVLESNTFSDAVIADINEARILRVNGVPFFALDNRYGVSGAQAVEVFADALQRAWQDAHAGAQA